ncbi:MAG: hypothetical protein JNL58_19930 [Planctomyces sp.]|nr:hypothetical protein [Planctomyces sp.]
MTCGLACALMAAYKVNKFVPGADPPVDEETVLKISDQMFGEGQVVDHGLVGISLVQVLNHPDLQMAGWTIAPGLSPERVSSEIVNRVGVDYGLGPSLNSNPIILLVQWSHNGAAHWVVIDSIRYMYGLRYATLCDPLDGAVHIVPISNDEPFSYTAQSTIAANLWGLPPIHDFGTQRTASSTINYVQNCRTHFRRVAITNLLYRET